MIYRTQSILRITLKTGYDMTGATETKIVYVKPGGERGEWQAVVDGTNMYYDTTETDIDQSGIWQFQAKVRKNGGLALGRKVTQQFLKEL